MKKLKLTIILLILMVSLTSCGSNSSTDSNSSSQEISKENVTTEDNISELSNPKVITSKNLTLETLDFEKTKNQIEKITSKLEGYIQSSNISNTSIRDNYQNSRYASFALKIPTNNCQAFEEYLKEEGNILNSSTESIDVTSQYTDSETRIKALKVREDRIVELLAKANDLSDVIKLEEELSNVIYEREMLQGSLNQIDKDVNYTSIYVEVMEVNKYNTGVGVRDSFIDKIINALQSGINNAFILFEGIILFAISLIPIIVLFAPVIIVVRYINKKNRNRKLKK